MSTRKFIAAVVQAAAVPFDRKASLEKLSELAAEVAGKGARIAVFPEAFISGYPSSLDWGGASAAIRGEQAAEDYRRYWDGALVLSANGSSNIADIARANKLCLVVGVIERVRSALYCTVVIHGPDGAYLGKHRKIMPTVAERLVWTPGDGSTLSVVDSGLGRLGSVICWENYLPELRMHMYRQGIELYCAPTADDEDSWIHSMRHIAVEGRCFVFSSNQYTTVQDFPSDYGDFPSDDPAFEISRGGSCIVNPYGELIAGPDYTGESLLFAEIDLDDIVRGKFYNDVAGHYSRPDIFTSLVDVSEKPRHSD